MSDHQPRAFRLRPALPADVHAIANLVEPYADKHILITKHLVAYFEDIQEFLVAVDETDQVIGCGALHVMWTDLAEIRTLAVREGWVGRRVGHALLDALVDQARAMGLERVFCLTFEIDFFVGHGFTEIQGTPVEPDVYNQLLLSHDDGVAEFLDLARVKPNTLGNTRMLLEL